ncbi:MAG: NADPH:quinone reductase, partial [Halofilum sp. (in: g-proteobacteria)]
MRAACYEKTGPAADVFRVEEVPLPEPGPGEVRVAVAFSGVNPSDVKTRSGARGGEPPFPRIVPHSDGSGTVDAVGEGVDSGRVGERVWLWNAAWGRPHGTAAEYLVLPAEQAVPLPDGVALETGACLGIPALTAYHAVHCHGGVAGQRVLIAGGAGAVGHSAIQIARAAGAAEIIATVSSGEKASIATAAGADTTIDYRREDVAARIGALTGGTGVDRVIEVALARERRHGRLQVV